MTAADRAAVVAVCERIRVAFPMIGGGLIDRIVPADDPCWRYASAALDYVASRSSDDLETEIEAFATTSMDFLRLQARFMRTGRYARASADGLVEELYGDPEKMRGYYLDGLALTYALWPNHAKMLAFMGERFLPLLDGVHRVAEVGVGHGLLAAQMLGRNSALDYVGVDISQSALDYAADALKRAGCDDGRTRMVLADAMSGELGDIAGGGGFEALVCCEVLEHVDEPERLLRSLAGAMAPGAVAFMSTVANLEADDHVYLFNDADHIRAMLQANGWVIVEDLANVLPGADDWQPLPVNYSAVLRAG